MISSIPKGLRNLLAASGIKISVTKLPVAGIRKIHSLLTLRDRSVARMRGYAVSKNEALRIMGAEYCPELLSTYEQMTIAPVRAKSENTNPTLYSLRLLRIAVYGAVVTTARPLAVAMLQSQPAVLGLSVMSIASTPALAYSVLNRAFNLSAIN